MQRLNSLPLCFTLFHSFLLADAANLRYEPCLFLVGLGLLVLGVVFSGFGLPLGSYLSYLPAALVVLVCCFGVCWSGFGLPLGSYLSLLLA